MGSYLDAIVAAHRRTAARDRRDVATLVAAAHACPPPRPFADALAVSGLSVIAELKRRSPSRGELAPDLDPADLAKRYEAGGAAALSVLTDGPHFGGAPADLAAARSASGLPVLRKDFTVDERDLADARLMGADAVLIIVAALDDAELVRFLALATELGLAALVEVHDEVEIDRAVAAGADVIGVNQRDLTTFEVDRTRAVRLASRLPDEVVRVAESGIRHARDAADMAGAGYDAVLVGESLVTSHDAESAVAALHVESV